MSKCKYEKCTKQCPNNEPEAGKVSCDMGDILLIVRIKVDTLTTGSKSGNLTKLSGGLKEICRCIY